MILMGAILFTAGIIIIGYLFIDLYKRYETLVSLVRQSLANLSVTINYDDISSTPHFNKIEAIYGLRNRLMLTGVATLAIFAGQYLILKNEVTIEFKQAPRQRIIVKASSNLGLSKDVYDMVWFGEDELHGNWQWRKYKGRGKDGNQLYGHWQPADLKFVNGN